MATVKNRIRIWNDLRTDCEIFLPGTEIEGDALARAIEQGFNPDTGEMGDPPAAGEAKADKPKTTKAMKAAPENK